MENLPFQIISLLLGFCVSKPLAKRTVPGQAKPVSETMKIFIHLLSLDAANVITEHVKHTVGLGEHKFL